MREPWSTNNNNNNRERSTPRLAPVRSISKPARSKDVGVSDPSSRYSKVVPSLGKESAAPIAGRHLPPIAQGRHDAVAALSPTHPLYSQLKPADSVTIVVESPPSSNAIVKHSDRRIPTTRVPRKATSNDLAEWTGRAAASSALQPLPDRKGAPLALALEAFIRKEFKQYRMTHPGTRHADLIHIVLEALAVFTDHFTEYRSFLTLVRVEVEAVVRETRAFERDAENADVNQRALSDFHSMQIQQVEEKAESVAFGVEQQLQEAQRANARLLKRCDGLERERARLVKEMDDNAKEFTRAVERSRALATSLTTEASKTQHALVRLRESETEVRRLRELLTSSQSMLEEADALVERQRIQLTHRLQSDDVSILSDELHDMSSLTEMPPARRKTSSVAPFKDGQRLIAQLQGRVDELKEEVAALQRKAALSEEKLSSSNDGKRRSIGERRASSIKFFAASPGNASATLPLPPPDDLPFAPCGRGPNVPAYLRSETAITNKCMPLDGIVRNIRRFWSSWQDHGRPRPVADFFMEWLTTVTGSTIGAVQLAYNLVFGAKTYMESSECTTFVRILEGRVSDVAVAIQGEQINHVRELCSEFLKNEGVQVHRDSIQKVGLPISSFSALLRIAFPCKRSSYVRRLKHFATVLDPNVVDIPNVVGDDDSPFLNEVRMQALREGEVLTTSMIEKVRGVMDSSKQRVSVSQAIAAVSAMKFGLSEDQIVNMIASASQMTVTDMRNGTDNIFVDGERLFSRLLVTVFLQLPTDPAAMDEFSEIHDGDE